MEFKRDFFAGVVEGFYGRPWLPSQRNELFLRLKQMGLNTYLYAPKDDLKHRQMWRELYSHEEASQIKNLIDASKAQNVIFIYALSPGLDITFSSSADIYLLKEKFNQVLNLGCNAFALLFDDIDPNLNNLDNDLFCSLAYAQATISNEIFNFINEPALFLFCPTEYCSTRAVPNVSKSEYLKTIGETLVPDIDVMWTGPKVISKYITLDSILELTKTIKRPPVIWDNIHANDYDQKRLFLGPYCGRSSKLKAHIRGVLLNPNCEFEANFIAIHTLAQWARGTNERPFDYPAGGSDQDDTYVPSQALDLALSDWLKLIYTKEKQELTESLNITMSHIILDSLPPPSLPSHSPLPTPPPTTVDALSNTSANRSRHESIKTTKSDQHDPIDSQEIFTSPQSVHKPETSISISPVLLTASVEKLSENEANLVDIVVDNKNEVYDFKRFYSNESANEIIDISQMDLAPKSEEIVESSENPNEMILDNVSNTFASTPMETEDNQGDLDNLTDSMAMQVDSIYDNICEKMDIIDYMENNCNSDKRKESKDVVSMKDSKSEMECVLSTKSSDASASISCPETAKLTVFDLHLLVNMFFLPYEHGPWAIKMLQLVKWLRSNAFITNEKSRHYSDKSSDSSDDQIKNNIHCKENKLKRYEWQKKAKEFSEEIEKVRNMVDRFTAIPNRSILYDLYPYLQDMRYVLSTLLSYVKWMGCEPGYNESLMKGDHEPWVFRGGLISEFQRMFPLEGSNDVFPNKISFIENFSECFFSSSDNESETRIKTKTDIPLYFNDNESTNLGSAIYMIQPYRPSTRNQLYGLCLDILCNQLSRDRSIDKKQLSNLKSQKFRNLPGDRYLGMYLDFCPDTCMVLEDKHDRICGYAFGTNKVKDFFRFRQETYNKKMRKKYEFYMLDKEAESVIPADSNNLPLDDVLPKSTDVSVIEVLIRGFNDNNWDKGSDMIYNSSHALIHVDILHNSKETKSNCLDSVGYKLLKSICSTLTYNKIDDQNYQPNAEVYNRQCSSVHEPLLENDEDFLCSSFKSSITTPDFGSCNSHDSSLAVFCEIDTLNKYNEDFYKKYGFDVCNVNGNITDVSLMSRYI